VLLQEDSFVQNSLYTHSSVMPKHLGEVRIAGASTVPPCFPAQVYTERWTISRPHSNSSTLWSEKQPLHFHFCLVFSPKLNSELNTKHAISHAVEPNTHCWHSWNLLDGMRCFRKDWNTN